MTSADAGLIVRLWRQRARATTLIGVAAAGILGGCAVSDSLTIDPGHYSVYHCKDMAARLQALQKRQKELLGLQEKASEGGGGLLIGNLSYRADYDNAVGEERVLRRTAADKKCDLPPPAEAASATPTAYSAPAYSAPPVAPASPLSPPPPSAPAPAGPTPVFQSDQTIR